MKVILLEDIYKQGVAGQVVKVADGFARNYLIPRKMAILATPSALKQTEAMRQQVEARQAAYDNKLNELGRQIDGVELIFGRRAAVTGKLFGSVTTQDIADSLMEATGVDINRRRISQQFIREIGTHEVPVRLGTDVSPELKIIVVREEELAEFLAARERGEEPEVEEAGMGAVAQDVVAGAVEAVEEPEEAEAGDAEVEEAVAEVTATEGDEADTETNDE